MRKINYLFIAGLTGLASCANNEYIGEGENPENVQSENGAILFSTRGAQATRGGDHVGADAAEKLGKNFVVMGTKGGTIGNLSSVVTNVVFDHYNVGWTEKTAGTTASNTSDWEYAGITPLHAYATVNGITSQTIKYWDYSTGQYDFIAYSGSNATMNYTAKTADQLYVTPITPASATTSAYTVAGAVKDLAKFYIADLVTVPQAQYGNEVQIKFRNITAKVRVGLYETVPGYSIRDVEFYASDDATAKVTNDVLTLYSQSANIYSDGTYTVYYPTVNKPAGSTSPDTDNNKAHVSFTASASGAATTSSYAALDYNNGKTLEDGSTPGAKVEKKYLGETSDHATYVTSSENKPYTTVLPNEAATALTLRCNYTLVSNDGSKETIKVWGAKAVIPAQYTQWKSNYAYTYLFKISDNTNGATEKLGGTTQGLHPITFDAVVTDSEDGLQETVTTVATPSITSYMKEAPNVTANDEYPAGTIYVMVQNGATILNLGGSPASGQLYTISGASAKVPATEANVMDALNMGSTSGDVTTGRNGLSLTKATSDATITAIPGVNGNNIDITGGQAASFSATAGNTYAYVYTVSDAADTQYYSAITIAKDADAKGYYTLSVDGSGNKLYTEVTESNIVTEDGGKIYYEKHTNNNTTYAVKVIKIKAATPIS